SGLTRNLKVQENSLIINTPNSENSLCGIGFGLMLSNVASVFFMKQQDFLLLGIDHLVNTFNFIRLKKPSASFTIMNIVVDSGYEGPQSCLNNLADFCSISRTPGFTITNKIDAEQIINSQLVSPGFRIISVSQRLANKDVIETEKIFSRSDDTLFKYTEGNDATIVCFNFTFPQGQELYKKLKNKNINSSLFSVNTPLPIDWNEIIQDVKKTGNIVIIDDSKSSNLSCDNLLVEVMRECKLSNEIVVKRKLDDSLLVPNPDTLIIDYEGIIGKLTASMKQKLCR
ncbi:MAG: hypothetical protein KJ976_08600, partial [Proteobacteria bacterium]|nr:hypothetical protein [Pseudomonadota bacterium]